MAVVVYAIIMRVDVVYTMVIRAHVRNYSTAIHTVVVKPATVMVLYQRDYTKNMLHNCIMIDY